MSDSDLNDKAIEAVMKSQAHRKPSSAHVRRTDSILSSTVFCVNWQSETESKRVETLVVFEPAGAKTYNNWEDFAKLGLKSHVPEHHDVAGEFLNLNVVAGVIALMITVAIVYLAILKPTEKMPDILANALTTILGFYFGSQVAKRTS